MLDRNLRGVNGKRGKERRGRVVEREDGRDRGVRRDYPRLYL